MERRIVNVIITPNAIETFLKTTGGEMTISIDGVPQDAEMVNISYDFEKALFYVTFRHETFENVMLGNAIPVITPIITRNYLGRGGQNFRFSGPI